MVHRMPAPIRPATRADIPSIARTLAAAFVDDPVKQHLTGLPHVPPERSLAFFDAFTHIQLAHEHVYVTEGGEAAALWSPPGEWKVPVRQIVRWSPRFVKMYGRRFLPNLKVLLALEGLHPTEPHYYLEFVGVHPDHQRKGFGIALLEPMVERADREGVGMYLENSKEKNLAFYGRHGFQVRAETHLPGRNGPPAWLMWRDPK